YDWEFRSQASYIMERCDFIHQCVCLQEMAYIENIVNIFNEYDGSDFVSNVTPEQMALIIFTSGTTGDSKGVMLSHANEIDNTFCSDNENPGEEVILGILPVHHVFCINSDIFMVIRYGNTLCISRDLKRMLADMQLFEPTFLRAVPAMLKAMINRVTIMRTQNPDMPIEEVKKKVWGGRLTKIASGGGYLSPDIAKRFKEVGVRIGQGYGMSECSPKISVPDYDRDDKVESIGFLVRGCEVRIVDGEIQVKSPSVMMGYYKDEEKTKETLTEDGWLCTGDLGYLDDDGFLYLTGRKKNLIILANGENVSPEGIENVFDEDLLVMDILVYGQNEKIAAEIYPNYEYAQVKGISDIEGEIQKLVDKHNEALPTYSRIASVKVRRDPFEKTSSKKIIRTKFFDAKEEAEERKKTVKRPQTDLQKEIYALVQNVLGKEDFGVDEDLFEQGLDSMGSFMLIEDFDSKLGRNISYNELMSATTVEKIEAVFLDKEEAAKIDYSVREKYPLATMMKYFGYVIRGNTTGNLPFTFKLADSIDLKKMQRAIATVLDAHPAVKGKIYPDETKWLAFFRHDDRKIEIPIEEVSDERWEELKGEILVPFAYTEDDDLFHIRLFKTPTAQYMMFDVSHIVGDGQTMNILLDDLNKAYCGEEIEKEDYTFYEYIIDELYREEQGIAKKSRQYYENLLSGLTLERSLLNKKEKGDLSHESNGVIRRRFNLVKKELLYFCNRHGISENALFLTAFNYTVGLFSGERDLFTCSIHSGRTDGRWRHIAGCLFRTYYTRYNVVDHETTVDLLKRSGRQIMDTMKAQISVPREGEMFFQYQADLIHIPQVGDAPAETVHLQLDSLPFHLQVMRMPDYYYYELRFWRSRFDEKQLEIFMTCYESVLRAMAMEEERSARRLKKHIPEEMFPKHYRVKIKDLCEEAGQPFFKDADENEEVAAYIFDELFNKKPFGAWGRLYILDKEPASYVDTARHPEKRGKILYDTGITARILPDGRIDFLENSGRIVLTDGTKGRRYYDLGSLERTLSPVNNVTGVHAYMTYDKEGNEMRLEMDVDTAQNSFINELRSVAGESLGEQMVPTVVNLRMTAK
ncbi:MAG: AMP-binding protein, partial [Lachnospiraceae bacterium]|nr:AMP-binding protein [Lachnospiraceae bacterium]